jgi:hypothetical protein
LFVSTWIKEDMLPKKYLNSQLVKFNEGVCLRSLLSASKLYKLNKVVCLYLKFSVGWVKYSFDVTSPAQPLRLLKAVVVSGQHALSIFFVGAIAVKLIGY